MAKLHAVQLSGLPKIETGVPIPSRRTGITAVLRAMNIGDSALFPERKAADFCGTFAQLKPMKFCCRTNADGCRIWRIK